MREQCLVCSMWFHAIFDHHARQQPSLWGRMHIVMSKLLLVPSLICLLLTFYVVTASIDSDTILRFSTSAFVSVSRRAARHSFVTKMSSSEKSSAAGGVVIVGSANQDLTSYTSIIPKMGETVMGSSFETSCGGKGANQAVCAASLGIAPSVTMVCRVGQDAFGADLLSNFRKS